MGDTIEYAHDASKTACLAPSRHRSMAFRPIGGS